MLVASFTHVLYIPDLFFYTYLVHIFGISLMYLNDIHLGYTHVWCSKPPLSEVGFEPTPTYVDCDLNAAP